MRQLPPPKQIDLKWQPKPKRRWFGMHDSLANLKPTHDPGPWPRTFDGWVNLVFDPLSASAWFSVRTLLAWLIGWVLACCFGALLF